MTTRQQGAPQDPELAMIASFLAECLPFNTLSDHECSAIAAQLEVTYYCHGQVLTAAADDSGLRLLRSGAAELRDGEGNLLDRLGEGESFNLSGLNEEHARVQAVMIEDSLVYRLPQADYAALRQRHARIDLFFRNQRARRLHGITLQEHTPGHMMRPISSAMSADVLTAAPTDTIAAVAQAMHARGVSSVIITEGDALRGIVTDRDLRSRVVAAGVPTGQPVSAIMTPDPLAIDIDSTLFDATLCMTRHGCHHLPLLDAGRLAGIVTTNDLILSHNDDPVYLVKQIARQSDVAGIGAIAASAPKLLLQWVDAGVQAAQAAHILTAISDAVTVRLIDLYCQQAGPAPVRFCWLGFGSQAREEQLIGADQDNGLLIDDSLQEAHRPWFEALARWVCDGLSACGYPYCPGGVMATTDEWRQTLSSWIGTVDRWTRSPTPAAVMRVSIFFDLRAVYGDAGLCERLQQHMLREASRNSIFLAALAANALSTTAPLGIFCRFLVERNGEHRDTLNLKKRGVMPIVDLTRVHALASGVTAVNTEERIDALIACGSLTDADGRNLRDALRFIMQLRIQAQADQLRGAEPTSNHIRPKDLPRLAREQLRDAFKILYDAQSAARLRYRAGL